MNSLRRRFCGKKGIALYLVLTMILLVTVLANVVIRMMLSHSRISRHELSRTQAYYAGLAAMNWARAQLQVGNLHYTGPLWPQNSCPQAGAHDARCDFADANLPPTIIQPVRIIFCPNGGSCLGVNNPACTAPAGSTYCIHIRTNYQYNAPVVP